MVNHSFLTVNKRSCIDNILFQYFFKNSTLCNITHVWKLLLKYQKVTRLEKQEESFKFFRQAVPVSRANKTTAFVITTRCFSKAPWLGSNCSVNTLLTLKKYLTYLYLVIYHCARIFTDAQKRCYTVLGESRCERHLHICCYLQ